jgi:hypothetical protein
MKAAMQTVKVTVDSKGRLRPYGDLHIPPGEALLTFPAPDGVDLLLLSEPSLASEWLSEEEDKAWECLQPAK